MSDSTKLATREPTPAELDFALDQRKASMFALSPLVPEHLRKGSKEEAIANCYIAMVLAKQMDENPLVVMQNIYIVKGKAGWSSSYMIAKANASGLFKGGLNFRTEGKGDSLAVTCFATRKDDDSVVHVTVSMEAAKAEGWTSNPKYKTMPEQMLRYRSAAFFVRTYCPQVMLGYQTIEEVEDVAAAEVTTPKLSIASVVSQSKPEVITTTGEVITRTDAQVNADTAEAAIQYMLAADIAMQVYRELECDDMDLRNNWPQYRDRVATAIRIHGEQSGEAQPPKSKRGKGQQTLTGDIDTSAQAQ